MNTKSLKVIHSLCRSLAIKVLCELTRNKCCLCRRGEVVATAFGGNISLPHRLCPACFNKLRQPILRGYLLVQDMPVPFFCAGAYEGVFQSLIHKIKYQGEAALCFDLAIVLDNLTGEFLKPEINYLLLPIPLHAPFVARLSRHDEPPLEQCINGRPHRRLMPAEFIPRASRPRAFRMREAQ